MAPAVTKRDETVVKAVAPLSRNEFFAHFGVCTG
jgi:hypothetical protein